MKQVTLTGQQETYFQELVRQRKGDYNIRDKLIKGLRRQRFMRNKLYLPKAYQELVGKNAPRAPLSYRLVQTGIGAIAKVPPKFYAVARLDSDKAVAERAQTWCSLMMPALSRATRRPLFWKMMDSLIGDGGAVVKCLRLPWSGFPVQATGEDGKVYAKRVQDFLKKKPTQPFVARVVDLATFYPPLSEWGGGEVVEHGVRPTRPTLESLRLHGSSISTLARLPDEQPYPVGQVPGFGTTIEVSEVWNDEVCALVLGGTKVMAFENIYGRVPYEWSPGITTSSYDPALEGVSLTFGLQYLQPWIDTMLAIIAAWSILGGNPIMWTSQDPVQGMSPSKEFAVKDIPFGKWIDFGVGGKGGYMEPPGVGQAINQAVEMMVNLADRVSLSPISAGFIGTRTPGLAISAAMEAATANLTSAVDNAQILLANVMKMLWGYVRDVVKAPVYVNGLILEEGEGARRGKYNEAALGPSDIDKLQDLLCELQAQSLQDNIAAGTHAAFMSRGPDKLWSKDRARRFSGVEQPEEEWRQIVRETIRELPEVLQYIAMRAVQGQAPLQAIMEQAMAAGQEGGAEAEPGRAEGETPTGQPKNIGGPAPRGGGRPSGSPKQPGGKRSTHQPRGRMR